MKTRLKKALFGVASVSLLAAGAIFAARVPQAAYHGFEKGYCTYFAAKQFDLIVGEPTGPGWHWRGDAGVWLDRARAAGWRVSSDANAAKVGAIVVWAGGKFGHVAIVRGVEASTITIEEMNWGTPMSNDGRTVNFDKVTRATLPASNLSRGSYRFKGYVFPERAGTPSSTLPTSPDYPSTLKPKLEYLRKAMPNMTRADLLGLIQSPKATTPVWEFTDLNLGNRVDLTGTLKGSIWFLAPPQMELSMLPPPSGGLASLADDPMNSPPPGYEVYQDSDPWYAIEILIDQHSATNRAFGTARIEAISSVLGPPKTRDFTPYDDESESDTGWSAEWQLSNGRVIKYLETYFFDRTGEAEDRQATLLLLMDYEAFWKAARKWRANKISDDGWSVQLSPRMSQLVRVDEHQQVDESGEYLPSSELRFATYVDGALASSGRLLGTQKDRNPDTFVAFYMIGTGTATRVLVDTLWSQGGSGWIRYLFLVSSDKAKPTVCHRLRLVGNPAGDPLVFGATMPNGRLGLVTCEALADGPSRSDPSRWSVTGYEVTEDSLLRRFSRTTQTRYAEFSFNQQSAATAVPDGWQLVRLSPIGKRP